MQTTLERDDTLGLYDHTSPAIPGALECNAVASCGALGCLAIQGNSKIAHCSACHLTFTTVRNFDAHRKNFSCVDPETVGLELKANGRYGLPGRLAP